MNTAACKRPFSQGSVPHTDGGVIRTYGEPSNGWTDDGLTEGEDHVMLNFVARTPGGWNDMADEGSVGVTYNSHSDEIIVGNWMSKGCYPLCQTRPPPVYDHNAHMSWEVETEQQFTDPITRQPAYYIAVGRVLPQTVSQQLCEGPPL